MKPVLVLQHLSADGPAHLAHWLRRERVGFDLRDTQAGDAYPERIGDFRALAVLGGEMSANDALPSLRRAEALILQAIHRGVPVIGHCLGGQLMARALGASVQPAAAPEIGWHAIQVRDTPVAREWFGADPAPLVFQWHFEAFELPPGAQWLAASPACPHQAFALGPHLAMQFHVELDAAKLDAWSASHDPHYLALQTGCATVQSGPRMRTLAASALPAQQRLAERLYQRWLGSAG